MGESLGILRREGVLDFGSKTALHVFESALIISYFMSILDAVPDSVEEVIVDADFNWRTEDGKFTSDGPAQKPVDNGIPTPTSEPKAESSRAPSAAPSAPAAPVGKRKAIEILSSDDEDGERPLSRSRPQTLRTPSASASVSVPPPANAGVIDLTLSDSEDEDEEGQQFFPPPGAGTGRDAVDSTRQSLPPIKTQEAESGARHNGDYNPVPRPIYEPLSRPSHDPPSRPAYYFNRPPPPRPRPQLPDTFSLAMDEFDLHSALYPDSRSAPARRDSDRSGASSGSKAPQLGTWDRPTSLDQPPSATHGAAPVDRWDPDPSHRSKRPRSPYNDWLTYDEELQNGDRDRDRLYPRT